MRSAWETPSLKIRIRRYAKKDGLLVDENQQKALMLQAKRECEKDLGFLGRLDADLSSSSSSSDSEDNWVDSNWQDKDPYE